MKKNSSNSYRLQVRASGETILDSTCPDGPYKSRRVLKSSEKIELLVDKIDTEVHLRLRVGTDVVAESPPQSLGMRVAAEKLLRDVLGETAISIDTGEGEDFTEDETYSFLIDPSPDIGSAYLIMVDDLTSIHEGLIRTDDSRGFIRATAQTGRHSPLDAFEQIERIFEKLLRSIHLIEKQPAAELSQVDSLDHYRAGDRIDGRTLAAIAGAITTKQDVRSILAHSKIPIKRPRVNYDIPEHRQIVAGLKRGVSLCSSVERCARDAMASLHEDEERWGDDYRNLDFFKVARLPRVQHLRTVQERASNLKNRLLAVCGRGTFLERVNAPRLRLSATPLFRSHTAYIQAYRALLDLSRVSVGGAAGDNLKVHLRSFSKVYEYWVYYQTVSALSGLFGPPVSVKSGSPQDGQLRPGDSFSFEGIGCSVEAIYEPSILPWSKARLSGECLGATLTARPLKPDVLLRYKVAGEDDIYFVVDAKSTSSFEAKRLRELSDYSRQVFEIESGRQPVKGVFLAHRDVQREMFSNVPGLAHGAKLLPGLFAVVALPAIPQDKEGCLRNLERLLRSIFPEGEQKKAAP